MPVFKNWSTGQTWSGWWPCRELDMGQARCLGSANSYIPAEMQNISFCITAVCWWHNFAELNPWPWLWELLWSSCSLSCPGAEQCVHPFSGERHTGMSSLESLGCAFEQSLSPPLVCSSKPLHRRICCFHFILSVQVMNVHISCVYKIKLPGL